MTDQQTTAIPMLRIPRSADPAPTTPRLRSAKVPNWAYALVIVAVFAGSIVLARGLGWFATTGRGTTMLGAAQVPGSPAGPGAGAGQGSGSEERVAPTAGAVPDDVKGWMTIQQVLDAFPVTKLALYERFAIPADTATDTTLSSLKESGDLSGFDVPTLRAWLGEHAPQ
jgi:hypothetical protein